MHQLLLPHGITITMFEDVGSVSDGFHTFNELYQHRCLLFCLLIQHDSLAWKSRLHTDGTSFEGWFLAGTTLLCLVDTHAELKGISYHLPLALWEMCYAQELPQAPAWDGATSMDVLHRLSSALAAMTPHS